MRQGQVETAAVGAVPRVVVEVLLPADVGRVGGEAEDGFSAVDVLMEAAASELPKA